MPGWQPGEMLPDPVYCIDMTDGCEVCTATSHPIPQQQQAMLSHQASSPQAEHPPMSSPTQPPTDGRVDTTIPIPHLASPAPGSTYSIVRSERRTHPPPPRQPDSLMTRRISPRTDKAPHDPRITARTIRDVSPTMQRWYLPPPSPKGFSYGGWPFSGVVVTHTLASGTMVKGRQAKLKKQGRGWKGVFLKESRAC